MPEIDLINQLLKLSETDKDKSIKHLINLFKTVNGTLDKSSPQLCKDFVATPREVARLIDQIKSEDVPAIFGSEVFPTGIVDQIAKEANVDIVSTLSDDDLPGNPVDPQNSYVGMMLENMKNMLVPLGGNVSALSTIDPQDTYSSN